MNSNDVDFDRARTLEQLEKTATGAPEYDSYLVQTCNRLRGKSLKDFTVEDLRIMVGQNIGLKYLIPLAIEVLDDNPLAEGDFYEGDLLCAVLTVEHSFWDKYANHHSKIAEILKSVATPPHEISEVVSKFHAFHCDSKP